MLLLLLLAGATAGRSQSPAMNGLIAQLAGLTHELTPPLAAGHRTTRATVYLGSAAL